MRLLEVIAGIGILLLGGFAIALFARGELLQAGIAAGLGVLLSLSRAGLRG